MYGLPAEYEATIDSWQEVTTYLDAIVGSRFPVVVKVGDEDEPHPRTHVSVRGILQWRTPADERLDLLAVVACHRPPRTARIEPITTPEDESLTSWVTLRRDRFESARLKTYDGDCYFFLTLWMGGSVVRLMDSNAH